MAGARPPRILPRALAELGRVLSPGGRVVFSVWHPAQALLGREANFERSGVEYRLGAERHTVADYVRGFERTGWSAIESIEIAGDEELALALPVARRYVGLPLLLVIRARRGA